MFVLYLSSLTTNILARRYSPHASSNTSWGRCTFITDVLAVALDYYGCPSYGLASGVSPGHLPVLLYFSHAFWLASFHSALPTSKRKKAHPFKLFLCYLMFSAFLCYAACVYELSTPMCLCDLPLEPVRKILILTISKYSSRGNKSGSWCSWFSMAVKLE